MLVVAGLVAMIFLLFPKEASPALLAAVWEALARSHNPIGGPPFALPRSRPSACRAGTLSSAYPSRPSAGLLCAVILGRAPYRRGFGPFLFPERFVQSDALTHLVLVRGNYRGLASSHLSALRLDRAGMSSAYPSSSSPALSFSFLSTV
jgi:hypothetical protein